MTQNVSLKMAVVDCKCLWHKHLMVIFVVADFPLTVVSLYQVVMTSSSNCGTGRQEIASTHSMILAGKYQFELLWLLS